MTSPFKFLDSYTKNDRKIFFGRDREIEELYHRVFESRIMLVYGVSGTGKSSLIHCGLANKFSDTDWLPIGVRRGGNINESMAAGINASSLTHQSSKFISPADFRKGVRSLYLDHYKPVFFIFDQFEELFIFGNKEEKKSFIQIVKAISESDLQCRLIFVMREEYMANITEFEKHIPSIFSNRVRIEKMSHSNALEAIKGPCKIFNIDLEGGFTEALLEKLCPDSADIELTFLQVYLDRIFKLSVKEKNKNADNLIFRREMLDTAGNVSDLLGRFLEEQIKALSDPEAGMTILKSFVSIKGTKKQITADEVIETLSSSGKNISPDTITDYLQIFVNLRILRDKDNNNKYELRHDSLASKIYEKITLVEKEILEIRSFIENAFDNYNRRNVLLSNMDLDYISKYESTLFLKGELKEFLKKSREASLVKIKAFKIISTSAAVVFMLILSGVLYYSLRSNSEVKSGNLASQSILMSNDYPNDAWEMAIEAYKLKNIPISEKALFESFYGLMKKGPHFDSLGNQLHPDKEIFDFKACNAEIMFARFSIDGELIYGYLSDSSIRIWNKKGNEIKTINEVKAPLLSLKLSNNNKFIGALTTDSSVYIWDSDNKKILNIKASYNIINPDNILNFSYDGKYIACVIPHNMVNIYTTSGEKFQTLSGHAGNVNGVNFSPDSRFIATCSTDSTVIIWYYNKNKSAFQEYLKFKGHRNTVWSACFSMNSDYILSASADSTVKIWDLNGKVKANQTIDKILYYACSKYCNAEFEENDKVIIKTRYKYYNELLNNSPIKIENQPEIVIDKECSIYNFSDDYPGAQQIFRGYFINMNNPLISKPINFLNAKYDTTKNTVYFTQIVINKDIKYSAYTMSDSPGVAFYSGTNDPFKIFTFEGKVHQFSKDGKYLLSAEDNYLKLYPADKDELIRLVNEKKIFGEIKSKRTYFKKWYIPK